MSQVTTGASSDFNQATSTAEAMVTQYGMSDAVGVRVFHDNKSSRQELVSSEINKLLNVRRHRSLFMDFVPDFFALRQTHFTCTKGDLYKILFGCTMHLDYVCLFVNEYSSFRSSFGDVCSQLHQCLHTVVVRVALSLCTVVTRVARILCRSRTSGHVTC